MRIDEGVRVVQQEGKSTLLDLGRLREAHVENTLKKICMSGQKVSVAHDTRGVELTVRAPQTILHYTAASLGLLVDLRG